MVKLWAHRVLRVELCSIIFLYETFFLHVLNYFFYETFFCMCYECLPVSFLRYRGLLVFLVGLIGFSCKSSVFTLIHYSLSLPVYITLQFESSEL